MTQGTTDGLETVVKIDEITALSGNTPTATGNMYAWNQKGGVVASSTRNMTGVYDLSGGLWEETSSYIANNHKHLSMNGVAVAYEKNILKTMSSEYTMVYPYDSNADNSTKVDNVDIDEASNANYIKNTKIYGDGIRETSKIGIGDNSWEQKYSIYAGLNGPFIGKGGAFWYSSHAGRLCFTRGDGKSSYSIGFRPVVVPK